MKQSWKVIMMALVFGLVVSGCGSKGEPSKNEGNNSAVTTNTEQKTKKNGSKEDKQDDSRGKIEFIGEKTKTIGRFEITLEDGEVHNKITQINGDEFKPFAEQFLRIKAKITAIKNVSGSFYHFMVYEAGEENLGDNNYIGAAAGQLGEQLEANLVLEDQYKLNEPIEGYLYLDVPVRDSYRIVYKDDYTQMDYWDVKITK